LAAGLEHNKVILRSAT